MRRGKTRPACLLRSHRSHGAPPWSRAHRLRRAASDRASRYTHLFHLETLKLTSRAEQAALRSAGFTNAVGLQGAECEVRCGGEGTNHRDGPPPREGEGREGRGGWGGGGTQSFAATRPWLRANARVYLSRGQVRLEQLIHPELFAKLCRLYAVDYTCFGMKLPPGCSGGGGGSGGGSGISTSGGGGGSRQDGGHGRSSAREPAGAASAGQAVLGTDSSAPPRHTLDRQRFRAPSEDLPTTAATGDAAAAATAAAGAPQDPRRPVFVAGTPQSAPRLPSTAKCASACGKDGGCFPLVYIVGAQKAATSSTFELLRRGAEACGASRAAMAQDKHGGGAAMGQDRHGGGARDFAKESHYLDACMANSAATAAAALPDGALGGGTKARSGRGGGGGNSDGDSDGGGGGSAGGSGSASGCSKRAFSALFRERSCASRCFVEATPNYLWDLRVATRLRAWATPREAALARFVVILRHPASRRMVELAVAAVPCLAATGCCSGCIGRLGAALYTREERGAGGRFRSDWEPPSPPSPPSPSSLPSHPTLPLPQPRASATKAHRSRRCVRPCTHAGHATFPSSTTPSVSATRRSTGPRPPGGWARRTRRS